MTDITPLYLQVFPAFGKLDIALPFGFEDQSNDQDDCPSFALYHGEGGDALMTLFVDHKDEAERAGGNPSRFHIYHHESGTDLTSNEWDEIMQFIGECRPTVIYFPGFEHEGEHIINPTCCDPRGMACDPREYGFELSSTGGGCMGWRKTLADGTEVLLTDEVGVSEKLGEFGEKFVLGFYDVDGSELGIWVMEVGVAYNSPEDAEEGDGTPRNETAQ